MMRCRAMVLLFVLLVGLTPGLHAQTVEGILQSVGLLPFDTLDVESYYVEFVHERLSPEWIELYGEQSTSFRYYKKGESQSSPGHTIRTGAYLAGPSPTPPVELFFRNYEIRITGIDHIADRMCHVVKVLARSDLRPALTVCIDAETGFYLSVDTYDVHGVPLMRYYTTFFDPNPDLSGITFHDQEPDAIEAKEITLMELQSRVPWVRLPDWIPNGFELIGMQLVSPENDELESLMLHYSDGLATIVLMLILWPDLVENPSPELFEEVLVPTAMASLHYKGEDRTKSGLIGMSMEVPTDDIARMLWSMLPE